jgi:hypothetical protein
MELKTNTREDTILDYRFAFERDIARRRGKTDFIAVDPLGECELCGEDYDKKVPHAKYCPACRKVMRRIRDKQEYNRGGRARKAQYWQEHITVDPVKVEHTWMNLAWVIVVKAFEECDTLWLREWGMEFLSYSGRPMNQYRFDSLLEKIYAKKKA